VGVTVSHFKGAPLLRLLRIGTYEHWCAGCRKPHELELGRRYGDDKLDFNGNLSKPSFTPAIVHEGCSYVLRDGVQHFFDNCKHELAGQSVPMPTFPPKP
jgi:hypothetical protein